MKKLLSLLMTFCMVFTMFAGVHLTSVAETGDVVVDEVDLDGRIDWPELGDDIESQTVELGFGRMELTWAKHIYDYSNSLNYEPVTGKFEEGNIYVLLGKAIASEGYCFDEDGDIYVFTDENYGVLSVEPGGKETETYVLGYVSFGEQVDRVDLNGFVEAEVGQKSKNQTFEGTEYVAKTAWYVAENGGRYALEEGTTFEDGKNYYCEVTIFAKEGYYFGDSFQVYADGCCLMDYEDYNDPIKGFFVNFNFSPEVDRIEFSGLPTAEKGKAIENNLTMISDVDCEVESYWEAYAGDIADIEEFGADKYQFYVEVYSEAVTFAEDLVFVIDGEEYEAFESYGNYAYIFFEYDFTDAIDSVQVSGIPTVTAGFNTEEDVEITVPADAPYEISSISWYDVFEGTEVTGALEAGNVYSLTVGISPKAGYSWKKEEISYTYDDSDEVNVDEFFVTEVEYNDDHNAMKVESDVEFDCYLDFYYVVGAEKVNSVEIELPSLLGKPVDGSTVETVEGSNCSVIDTTFITMIGEGDVFEKGGRYWGWFTIKADQGYYFPTDGELCITVGDETYRNLVESIDGVYAEIIVPFDIDEDGNIIQDQDNITTEFTEEQMQEWIDETTSDTVKIKAESFGDAAEYVNLSRKGLELLKTKGKNLEIEMAEATVVVSKEVADAIAQRLDYQGSQDFGASLGVEAIEVDELNGDQIRVLSATDPIVLLGMLLYDTYTGNYISEFDGNPITVKIPCTLPAGTTADEYSFVYVGENGSLQDVDFEYKNGCVVADLYHFSEYALVKTSDFAGGPGQKVVGRLYGSSRYDTSFGIADGLKENLGVDKFGTVIIANGANFPDALAGSYLAAKKNAPILMTDGKAKTNQALCKYISENMKADGQIYILGGTGAVPQTVEDALETIVDEKQIKRLSGKGRYDTNLAILEEAGVTNEEILVCTGTNFADSLSASAVGLPMLLVDPAKKTLSDAQKEFLAGVDSQITIIGGEGAVPSEYEALLEDYDKDGTVERIKGSGRYETSVRVAETYFDDPDIAIVAYAHNFPDGLCGGPLAYSMDAPLLLTGVKMISAKPSGSEANGAKATATYISDNAINMGIVLGGKGVLTDNTVRIVFGLSDEDKILDMKYSATPIQ